MVTFHQLLCGRKVCGDGEGFVKEIPMNKIYTSNGAGDVLLCLDDDIRTLIAVVAVTGSAPKADTLAMLLNRAYQEGRASIAAEFQVLLAVTAEEHETIIVH